MKNPFGLILASASLFAAVGWLLTRVVIGLDFTDEMQYYGEIASLTRTGKFFQDDLFIQQLGYFFLLPFFKLHAAVFPDQSYLLVFGRLLLVGAYALVGTLFWRAAGKLGGFPTAAKLTGLAAFVAWIPFQIFAPCYNSLSYLLLVGIAASWITRDHRSFRRQVWQISPAVAALTVVYPPAGVVVIAFLTVQTWRREGTRRALGLLGALVFCGAIFGLLMMGLHGKTFGGDLLTALEFSRSFRVGYAVSEPEQLAGGITLLVASGLFLWRMRRGVPFPYPLGERSHPALRWATLFLLVGVAAKLVVLSSTWAMGYFPAAGFIFLLMLLAGSVEPAGGTGPSGTTTTRRVMLTALGAGGAVLVAMSMKWATGYFATTVSMLLLMGLAVSRPGPDVKPVMELVMLGSVLAAIFAFTSGNGLHNFGMGAAVVLPFLLLYATRQLHDLPRPAVMGVLRHAVTPSIVALLLLNAASYPYREQISWAALERTQGVPAFEGIWTALVKTDAVKFFHRLAPHGEVAGKRLLVAGPHPWAYFAFRAQPATPMFFMHFTGGDAVHQLVADRLFIGGEPDAILITNPVPPQIHAKITLWMEKGCTAEKIALPPWFTQRYHDLLRYELGGEALLLRRAPKMP